MSVRTDLSSCLPYIVLLILACVSFPSALGDAKDRKEWEKDRREWEKDRREAVREWEKDEREALREAEKERREWEKDRREAMREWEKDRREAIREMEKEDREYYRRGVGPYYGGGGRPYPRDRGVHGRIGGEIIF